VTLTLPSVFEIGILCFIFVPKIVYQRKGLEEGVGVGESIMRRTHRDASTREKVRRSSVLSISGDAGSGLSFGAPKAFTVNPCGHITHLSDLASNNEEESDTV
jgi:hypothetical protein